MAKQIFYHGSYCELKEPYIIKTKYNKDFGDGFYLTLLNNQAIKWAKKYDTPILNVFLYTENKNLNIKEFNVLSEEWLDFVVESRKGGKHNYDIVIGPSVDDQIYNYINDYLAGVITRGSFWELAKFRYPTHQIAFCTKESLETLKFLESREVYDE